MTQRIEIAHGLFTAQVLPIGATLSRFQFGQRDLILGFCDPDDHRNVPIYAGAIVGPVANRVSDGRITIDNEEYQMERNENGLTTLHSGKHGLHSKHWLVTDQSQNRVELSCDLHDGECGLPGNRKITASYTLDASGLTVEITAQSDQTTPINITHHPYWTLEPDLAKTHLQVEANRYLPTTSFGLPTGQVLPVADTCFDFTSLRPVGPNSAIDHNYCIATNPARKPRNVARLVASDGLELQVSTTEPGLQVYTGSGLPELPNSRTFGQKIAPNAGIALEPQGWPDAPNNENFPSIFIDLDQTYEQITRYQIVTPQNASILP